MRIADDPWRRLWAGRGLVAFAGAGGKKTAMYALAARCSGSVGITTTVHCPYPPAGLPVHPVIAEPGDLEAAVRAAAHTHRQVFFARPTEREGWAAGLPPDLVADLHREGLFDTLLVKADGARQRLLKAPGEGEPVYPDGTGLVLYLVSAHVLGRGVVSGVVHRPEPFMAVTGARAADVVTVDHVVALLASGDGALKGLAADTRLVAVVNRVDTPGRARDARAIAERALAATPRLDAVALARMGDPEPWLEVVVRA